MGGDFTQDKTKDFKEFYTVQYTYFFWTSTHFFTLIDTSVGKFVKQ